MDVQATTKASTGREILEAQNSDQSLQDLAAQRLLYDRARLWFRAEFVVGAVLTATMVAVGSEWEQAAPWAAAASIVFPLLAHIVRSHRDKNQRAAALIQERFDCRVLRIQKSASAEATQVPLEDIVATSQAFRRKHSVAKLRDWYAKEIADAPFSVARLFCQRENVQWDRALKGYTGSTCIALVVLTAISTTVAGLLDDLSLKKFIVFIAAPAFPLAYSFLVLGLDLRRATATLDSIRHRIEGAWDDLRRSPNERDLAETHARQIQDDILRNRTSTPLVPKALYWLFREKQEVLAGITANQLLPSVSKASDQASSTGPS